MTAIGELTIEVDDRFIDANRHVNNVQYVQWMQDAAMAHSDSLGWSYKKYVELGSTWVIRSHTIEYLHSTLSGDILTVYTWVSTFRKFRSSRKYKFYRAADDTVIARAETMFIFCDIHTGKPRTIPPEVLESYTIVDDADAP